MARKRNRKVIVQPLHCTQSSLKKSCRQAVSRTLKPPSTIGFNVLLKHAPNEKGVDGRFLGGEVARIHGAMVVKGNWWDPKGCYVTAKRAISKGEVFLCTRVRFVLRSSDLGAANPWQLWVPHVTASAVCRQMVALGHKGWDIPNHRMFVGPCREGKQQCNDRGRYTEMTPPEDRSGEVIFRVNACDNDNGGHNVRFNVKLVRPREKEGIMLAVPQVCLTAERKIEEGEELLAQYDYRFSLE